MATERRRKLSGFERFAIVGGIVVTVGLLMTVSAHILMTFSFTEPPLNASGDAGAAAMIFLAGPPTIGVGLLIVLAGLMGTFVTRRSSKA